MSIKEIGAVELAALVKEKSKLKIIDVRSVSEIVTGTVEGANSVPLHTIPLRIDEINKNEKIVFICRSGARSAQAVTYLQQQGYNNIFNLVGGIISWTQHGFTLGHCAECTVAV